MPVPGLIRGRKKLSELRDGSIVAHSFQSHKSFFASFLSKKEAVFLSTRSNEPELMDAADFDEAGYRACLADLEAVNRLTLTHRTTLKFLKRATSGMARGSKISVLDVAFGHGDLLRQIGRWADKSGFEATLSGVDLNPRSAVAARAATTGQDITYHTGDVFGYAPAQRPDFIVTSQFTHHLTDAQIVRLLKWLDRTAARGWHIADLHRHWLPHLVFPLICRVMGWHRVVRIDGGISITRGFTGADWARYLAAAGVSARIRWSLPFRHSILALK